MADKLHEYLKKLTKDQVASIAADHNIGPAKTYLRDHYSVNDLKALVEAWYRHLGRPQKQAVLAAFELAAAGLVGTVSSGTSTPAAVSTSSTGNSNNILEQLDAGIMRLLKIDLAALLCTYGVLKTAEGERSKTALRDAFEISYLQNAAKKWVRRVPQRERPEVLKYVQNKILVHRKPPPPAPQQQARRLQPRVRIKEEGTQKKYSIYDKEPVQVQYGKFSWRENPVPVSLHSTSSDRKTITVKLDRSATLNFTGAPSILKAGLHKFIRDPHGLYVLEGYTFPYEAARYSRDRWVPYLTE